MKSLYRLSSLFVLLTFVAVGLTACGEKEKVHEGETEAVYLDIGDLKYQVQISRQLNANVAEDRAYLQGVGQVAAEPNAEEEWFGVFMRVQNTGDRQVRSVAPDQFSIKDTQGTSFTPVSLWTVDANPFVYRAQELTSQAVLPSPNSAAGGTPIQGSLVLFKLPRAATENRPLKFVISNPDEPGHEVSVNLDI